MIKKILLILFFLFACSTFADVYKSIDAQGNVIYSDTPQNAQAEKIDLPEEHAGEALTTTPAEQQAAASEESHEGGEAANPDQTLIVKAEKKPYTKFSILSPANGETIQNQPNIMVEISIDPPLQEGDMIQIYLDNNPWGPPAHASQFQFTKPDRGTHQISAKLIGDNNTVLKDSGSNTVYIHQAHIPNSPPVRN
jgi:hypothetical protein